MDRQALGQWAEQAAAAALEARGYQIIARNVRMQRGEIDIIARRDGRLWFVESKCRSRTDRGAPHLAVDRRKRRALFAAAREYVYRQRFRGDYGFLIASVLPSTDGRPVVTLHRTTLGPSPS